MITRRTAVALAALLPAIRLPSRLDVEEIEHNAFDTTEVNNYSLSPDGSKIFGTLRNLELAVIDVATNEVILTTNTEENELALKAVDLTSVRWSPDSTRLAYSMSTGTTKRDSDINVLDAETGEITGLTAEGFANETDRLKTDAEVFNDLYPVWQDDETLLFTRTEGIQPVDPPQICTVNLNDGEVETLFDLGEMEIMSVDGPIHLLTDGQLVLQATFESRDSGIVVIAPDGTHQRLNLESIPSPALLHAGPSHAVVLDMATFRYALVPLNGDGEIEFADEFFSNTVESVTTASAPICGPNANEFAMLTKSDDIQRVVIMRDGERQDLGKLDKPAISPLLDWQGDTLFIGDREKYWLIDVAE